MLTDTTGRVDVSLGRTKFCHNESIEVCVNDDTSSWEEPGNLEGHYANCFKVGYNAFEFVIDFGQMTGEGSQARLTSRVLTNPGSAKALYETLQRTLEEYERTFGVIHPEKER